MSDEMRNILVNRVEHDAYLRFVENFRNNPATLQQVIRAEDFRESIQRLTDAIIENRPAAPVSLNATIRQYNQRVENVNNPPAEGELDETIQGIDQTAVLVKLEDNASEVFTMLKNAPKLSKDNYKTWSDNMRAILNLKGFSICLKDPDVTKRNQLEEFRNELLASILITNISDDLRHVVDIADGGRVIWNKLKNHLAPSDYGTYFRLKNNIHEIKYSDDEDMKQHIELMNKKFKQLAEISPYANEVNEHFRMSTLAQSISKTETYKFILHAHIDRPFAEKTYSQLENSLLELYEQEKQRKGESSSYSATRPSAFKRLSGYADQPPEKKTNNQRSNVKLEDTTSKSGETICGRCFHYYGYRAAIGHSMNDMYECPNYPKCHECGQKGHILKNCPKRNGKNKANAAIYQFYLPICYDLFDEQEILNCNLCHFSAEHDEKKIFIIDSGSTEHNFVEKSFIENLIPYNRDITIADGKKIPIEGKGEAFLNVKYGHSNDDIRIWHFNDVNYVPKMNTNLISTQKLCEKSKCEIKFGEKHCYIIHKNSKPFIIGDFVDGSYILNVCEKTDNESLAQNNVESQVSNNTNISKSNNPKCIHEWHNILGHRNLNDIRKMKYLNIKKCTCIDECESCQRGKQTKKCYHKISTSIPITEKLQVISSDICGPMNVNTIHGEKYYISFTDSYTGYTWIKLLKTKDQAADEIINLLKYLFNNFSRVMKIFKVDQGPELISERVRKSLNEYGVILKTTCRFSSNQNAKIERKHRTIMDAARSMLFHAGLPKYLWGYAVKYAVNIQNTLPSGRNQLIPCKEMFDLTPNHNEYHEFGCSIFVHIPEQKRKKLDERCETAKFLGFDPEKMGIYCYNGKQILTTRDVVFAKYSRPKNENDKEIFFELLNMNDNENLPESMCDCDSDYDYLKYKKSLEQLNDEHYSLKEIEIQLNSAETLKNENENNEQNIIQEIEENKHSEENPTNVNILEPNLNNENVFSEENDLDESDITNNDSLVIIEDSDENVSNNNNENIIINEPDEEESEETQENYPCQSHNDDDSSESDYPDYPWDVSYCRRARVNTGISKCNLCFSTLTENNPIIKIFEPKTHKQAMECKDRAYWQEAMNNELNSLNEMNTWSIEDLPEGKIAIGNKWVFKVKYNSEGYVEKYKARLVAKGYTQKYGQDYWEVFAPVGRPETLKMLLNIASQKQYKLSQFDVQTAFLNGDLFEDIYMKPPIGHELPKGKVYKLKKSLYGLKQAARAWNDKFKKALIKGGAKQSLNDPCLFIMKCGTSICYILIHVDDILACTNNPNMIESLEKTLNDNFVSKNLGEVRTYLGISISRDNSGIYSISQENYIDGLVDKFNLISTRKQKIPMISSYHADRQQKCNEKFIENNTEYRSIIGGISYIANSTRPDIAVSSSILSRNLEKPLEFDMKEAKKVVAYLRDTKKLKLKMYDSINSGKYDLVGYVDSDYGEAQDRKSQTGLLVFRNGGLISWKSKRQSTVAQSTAEAEYVSIAECCKELLWIKNLCLDFGIWAENIMIKSDSMPAISMSEGCQTQRCKQIDIKHHFIRDILEKNIMNIEYVSTEENIADLLTKPLKEVKVRRFAKALGLKGATRIGTLKQDEENMN